MFHNCFPGPGVTAVDGTLEREGHGDQGSCILSCQHLVRTWELHVGKNVSKVFVSFLCAKRQLYNYYYCCFLDLIGATTASNSHW